MNVCGVGTAANAVGLVRQELRRLPQLWQIVATLGQHIKAVPGGTALQGVGTAANAVGLVR